jgi:predicted RNA-binding protein
MSLSEKLDKLPKDATITDCFRAISEWEEEAMREFRKRERTSKSGYLKPRTQKRVKRK